MGATTTELQVFFEKRFQGKKSYTRWNVCREVYTLFYILQDLYLENLERHNENRDTFKKDLTFKIVTDLM